MNSPPPTDACRFRKPADAPVGPIAPRERVFRPVSPVPADPPGKTGTAPDPVRESYLGRLVPYFDRDFRLSWTPTESSFPRMMWYRTPGRSLTLPPRIKTTECS